MRLKSAWLFNLMSNPSSTVGVFKRPAIKVNVLITANNSIYKNSLPSFLVKNRSNSQDVSSISLIPLSDCLPVKFFVVKTEGGLVDSRPFQGCDTH